MLPKLQMHETQRDRFVLSDDSGSDANPGTFATPN